MTSLGIGEALVTVLNDKGIPTPLAATMMRAPMSRMNVLSESEITDINNKSKLVKKYSEVIDRESAYEILNRKIQEAVKVEETKVVAAKPVAKPKSEPMSDTTKTVVKVLTSATFIRGAFGILSKMFKRK